MGSETFSIAGWQPGFGDSPSSFDFGAASSDSMRWRSSPERVSKCAVGMSRNAKSSWFGIIGWWNPAWSIGLLMSLSFPGARCICGTGLYYYVSISSWENWGIGTYWRDGGYGRKSVSSSFQVVSS